jgi:peptide methionine sulfoxide reductase MsrB
MYGPAYKKDLWDNKKPEIYADVVSGEPLLWRRIINDSGPDWSSFTCPPESINIITYTDHNLFISHIEVHSENAGSHHGYFLRMVCTCWAAV